MFTMVKASEVFPMRTPVKEHEKLTACHPLVPGECFLFIGETRAGVVSLSNYRIHVTCPNTSPGFINIPLGLVESAEQRDLFYLHIYCKDARSYRVQFASSGAAEEWCRRLLDEISPPVKMEDVFAFAHFAWAAEGGHEELSEACREEGSDFAWFRSELARLRFDLQGAWRVSLANQEHKLCPTYPQEILLPASISDSVLEKVAQFRSQRRIPAVVWRNTANGAVLARCSQPEVGWLGWRSGEDEELVRAIAESCAYDSGTLNRRHISGSESGSCGGGLGEIPSLKDLSAEAAASLGDVKKVLIIDARSYAAAVGNRARGGGVECPEYYPNAEILFMNLANIHGIRKSFQGLRSLCQAPPDQTSWFQAIDSTKWLSHMSGLLRAAVRTVTALQTEGRPVIVHCSDGWDRTPQLVSLAQLLLDPYYRTLEGFQVLVEKEWLDFGHKMADRCGQGLGSTDTNERSPIFLQWLDCVHQLLLQFPCHFEFNLTFLVKLAEHTYSNLFGTFLTNNLSERRRMRVRERTRSIWGYLRSYPSKFRNFLFVRREEVLWPRCEVRDLLLWQDVYVWEGLGGAGGVSSSQGSREGSESGEGILADEIDKLQNGNASPCRRLSNTETNVISNSVSQGVEAPQGQTSPRLGRRASVIESSTDTLVPETSDQAAGERSEKEETPAANWTLGGSDLNLANGTNGTLPSSGLPQPIPLQQTRLLEEAMALSSCSNGSQDPLDSDGLVAHNDQVQRRMVEIFSQHRAEVTQLKRDLNLSRLALQQAGLQPAELGSNVEEEAALEAISGVESTNSECMGCHTQFWFGRRKHHCRSCGLLFCSECSEQAVPIPTEQLYQPVRVCDRCYVDLSGLPLPPRGIKANEETTKNTKEATEEETVDSAIKEREGEEAKDNIDDQKEELAEGKTIDESTAFCVGQNEDQAIKVQ